MNPFRPISISLSPNTEKDDIWLAFELLFQPWRYKNIENGSRRLEEEFKKYLNVNYAISFNSLRSAFLASLKSLGLNKDDEVLLQAFTCNAAANPIIWSGLKPVYVDCDEKTFNVDAEDLKRKITSKSKAVVVQHTFGLPADLEEILEICQENNLILIEDCAHSLGAEYYGKTQRQVRGKIGTFGRISLFSFSRDKVISSVYGGMVATDDDELAKKIKEFQGKIGYPSCFWIFQQLLHPILLNWIIIPSYRIFGKYLFVLLQELHILSKAVHFKEKRGEMPGYFPKRMPDALAALALNQLKKIDRFNEHRKELAAFYAEKLNEQLPDKGHIFLRYTIRRSNAHQIIRKAWDSNLLIGDWYMLPIAPGYSKLEKIKYGLKNEMKVKDCPVAEKLAKETLNLPTHINISKKEAQKIIDFLKQNI